MRNLQTIRARLPRELRGGFGDPGYPQHVPRRGVSSLCAEQGRRVAGFCIKCPATTVEQEVDALGCRLFEKPAAKAGRTLIEEGGSRQDDAQPAVVSE
jgi:hypothetical protein